MVRAKADRIIQEGRTLAYPIEPGFGSKSAYMCWGVLPGEECELSIIRKKKNIYYAHVEEITHKSKERRDPSESHYLSCSPFSIMEYDYELKTKEYLVSELFVDLIDGPGKVNIAICTDNITEHYRNKIEYNFWETEKGNSSTLEFCFFVRESKKRITIDECSLASKKINEVARSILVLLKDKQYSSYNLKSLVLRESDQGIIASLFIKDEIEISIDYGNIKDLFLFEVHFSDHRAPVSRSDKLLFRSHRLPMTFNVLDNKLQFSSESFTQINLPMFSEVLRYIKAYITSNGLAGYPIYDIYCGVGSIGLSIIDNPEQEVYFLDNNVNNIDNLRANVERMGLKKATIKLSEDSKLDFKFMSQSIVILDPPRAGLSERVIDSIKETLPEYIVYLSCNPITQARDLQLLHMEYKVVDIKVYNFFPKTPHIEVLIILSLR